MSARPDGRKGIVGLLRSVLFGLGVAVAWCGLGGETAQSQSGKAEIYISDSAKVDGIKRDKFNLRPNVEIPYFVFVKNTADADKTFEVKLLNADDSSEITKSAPTPVAAGTTVPVKLLPPMPPPDPKSLPECPAAGFKLVVADAMTKKIITSQDFSWSVMVPSLYLNPSVTYVGEKNRLDVKIEAKNAFVGPPCKTNLVLFPDQIPGLVVTAEKEGAYSDSVTAKKAAHLSAQNLTFREGPVRTNGLVYLTVDGYERAFIFTVTFDKTATAEGSATQLKETRVNLRAARYTVPDAKFPLKLEIDNAPDSTHSIELGFDRAGTKSPTDLETQKNIGDRAQQVGYLAGKDGAIAFKATVSEWTPTLDLSEVFGTREVQVRLLDRGGSELSCGKDSEGKDITAVKSQITVDNTPPKDVQIVGAPAEHSLGKPLALKAKGRDPESGIKEILFFFGKLDKDGNPPKEVQKIVAPFKPGEKGEAEASVSLVLPADKKDFIEISAEFVNGAGKSSFATVTIPLVAGSTGPKGGTVAGTVMEGDRPQDLEVNLFDDKGVKKLTVKANEKGEYKFENVEPGSYTVSCAKSASRTKAAKQVKVEAGKTSTAALVLFR